MTIRRAACCCGQLSLACEGEPVRISVCHCLECQRRTGSVFGTSARFAKAQVTRIDGRSTAYTRIADSANSLTFRFCPDCGTTVYWTLSDFPDVIAVAVGTFADPAFPPPARSVYERRRHPWAEISTGAPVQHID